MKQNYKKEENIKQRDLEKMNFPNIEKIQEILHGNNHNQKKGELKI